MEDWRFVKEGLSQKLTTVNLIKEEMLQVNDRIGQAAFGVVHIAQWKGRSVAVKKVKHRDIGAGLEDLAQFISDDTVHA